MTILTINAHCVDDEFEAEILEHYDTRIIDRSNEPWEYKFEGPLDKMKTMLVEHWGMDYEEITADLFE